MVDLKKNLQKITFASGNSKEKFISIALVLIITIFYLLTINDGRDFSGDTAKFQFAGKILAIIHPPGYPNYLILNHIFVKIFPLGSLAFKANLLSSIFSILSAFFLLRILLLLGIGKLSSFITTVTFSLTFTLWSQSIYAEVYTLNILFFASTIYFFLKWNIDKREKFLLTGCFFYALSFGNHISMIALFPAIFYLTFVTDKNVFLDLRKIVTVFIFIVVGALQYSYLFIRNESSIYAEMQIENFKSLIWFVTGGWFKSKFFSLSFKEILLLSIPRLIYYIFREFFFLFPIIFLGFFKFRREIKIFFLLSILGNIIIGLNYDIGDIYVYYLPSYFVFAIFLGKGIEWVERKFLERKRLFKAFCGVVIPLLFFSINYPFIKRLRNFEDDKRAKEILSFVDKDSIILTTDYRTYEFLLYFLFGEGRYKEKNINVEFCNSLEEVRIYLCENYPFYSPHFRKNISLGKNVYFIKSKYLPLFKKSGLKISNTGGELYKIEGKKRRISKRPFFLVEYPLKDTIAFAFHTNRKIDYKMSLKADSEIIEIKGRARIFGTEGKGNKIFIIFKSDKRSYVFDNFLKNSEDLFEVRIPKNELEDDFYGIGIFIKGKDMESLWFTDKFYGVPSFKNDKEARLRMIKSKYKKKFETLKEQILEKFL